MTSRKSFRVASFDGGGPRSFSQLIMMKRFMHQLSWKISPENPREILPCEYFDLIGGSDTGGIIAIMLTKLRMSVKDAIKEFGIIVDTVYAKGLRPEERTEKLRDCMESLLKQRERPIDLALEGSRDGRCLGLVMAASSLNVSDKVRFRTYLVPTDPPSEITVVEAALATCASPSEFLPVPVGSDYEKRVYAGAGIGANNPVRHILDETSIHFSADPSLLLSLGSGHPGVLALDREKHDLGLHALMLEMMGDCEQEAVEAHHQLGHCDFYYRFSVVQGMQKVDSRAEGLEWIAAQTDNYFKLPEMVPEVAKCVHQMTLRSKTSVPDQPVITHGNIQGTSLGSVVVRSSFTPEEPIGLSVPQVQRGQGKLTAEETLAYILKGISLESPAKPALLEPPKQPASIVSSVAKQGWSGILWGYLK